MQKGRAVWQNILPTAFLSIGKTSGQTHVIKNDTQFNCKKSQRCFTKMVVRFMLKVVFGGGFSMKKIGCCQRLLLILHLLLIVVFAVACADHHVSSWQQIQPRPAGTPLTIWIATDLHYLSEDLTDEGTLFLSTMENGDGKLTECTPEILDEFVAQVLKARPDALILSGDLTFNGERKSLEDLTEKLNEVQDAGIPVLVIPGNHDIDYPLAFDYEGDSYTMAENITMDSFRQICGGLGYDMAMSRDESSFSYMYQLAEDVQILMLDGNTSEAPGAMGEDTLDWAEKQLKAARENERMVFSVSHQNVLPQNQLLYYGFAFYNYEDVAALLQKYGVTANFSGHSHIQHVSQDQGLKDYATGALSR